MAINNVMGLTLDLAANTDQFVKDLQKAAKGVQLDFDAKPLVRSFGKAHRDIQKILGDTIADAASAGFKKAKLEGLTNRMVAAAQAVENQSKKAFDAQLKARQKSATDAEKQAAKIEANKLTQLMRRLDVERKSQTEMIDRQKKAMEEMNRRLRRSWGEAAKDAAETTERAANSLADAINQLKSGNLGGVLKSAGGGASKLGASLSEKAANAKALGGNSGLTKIMGEMGGLLTKIGPAIVAVGALAGGFAALLGVVVAADSAMKDLNRTLLSNGVRDFQMGVADLEDTLNRVRSSFAEDFMFNVLWGTTAKDHMEILGSYAEAGISLRDMAKGARNAGDEMERVKQHTVAALTYSKLLGLSTQETTGHLSSYMESLGLTLEGVQKRFSSITHAAKDSGFSTKRFFNMVLQATSGMSMYNVRLEEAAGLLINLGKILGQQMGGDFLQNLTKGFKDEDTQTRIKKSMTTGIGLSLEILKKDAIKSSEEFGKQLEELGKSNADAQAKLKGVLGDLATMDPQQRAEKLAKMSQQDRNKLIAQAGAIDPAMGRQLSALAGKSTAFRGGLAGAQAAREEAGPAAALLLQMNEMTGVLGKDISQIDPTNMVSRMAFENATGKSGEEYRKLAKVAQTYSGRQSTIAEAQQKARAGDAGAATDFNRKFAKEFGVVLDSKGQRFKAILDEAGEVDLNKSLAGKAIGDSFNDLVMATGDTLSDSQEAKVAEDILLAQQVAKNTTDMSKILEQGVEFFLSKIYNVAQDILALLGGSKLSEDQQATRAKALGQLESGMGSDREQLQLQLQRIQELQGSKSLTEEEKAELAKRQEAASKLRGRIDVQAAQRRALSSMSASDLEKYGSLDSAEGMIAATTSTGPVKAAIDQALKTQGVAGKAAAARGFTEFEQQQMRQGLFYGDPAIAALTAGETAEMGGRAEDAVYAGYANAELGVTAGSRNVDASMLSLNSDQSATALGGKSTADFLGDVYIEETKKSEAAADQRSKEEARDAEKRDEKLRKGLDDDAKKREEEKEIKTLAALLATVGVTGDLEQKAQRLREGHLPLGVDPNKMVNINGQETRLGDYVASRQNNVKVSQTLAKDYMVHIDSQGRVVSAQKVSAGDTMYAAAMPTGAMTQATRRAGRGGGGGGNVFVMHNYAGEKTQKEVIKKLAAARLLG